MKKILFALIFAIMAISLPLETQGANDKSTSHPINLEGHQTNIKPNQRPHRAPMHICVDAYYDELSSTITVNYDGEASGEVFLYHNGVLIERSSDINTTFIITESGNYAIEINTEYWTATGSIDI